MLNSYQTRKYLEQIEELDYKIREKLQELEDAKAVAGATGGFDYSKERVKNSPSKDAMADKVVRYVDLESKIQEEGLRYLILKNEIINQIMQISDVRYVNVLVERYINYRSITEIARGLHYSYDWTRHLMSRAISEFAKILEREEKR